MSRFLETGTDLFAVLGVDRDRRRPPGGTAAEETLNLAWADASPGAAGNLGNIYTKNALANNERNRYMAEGVNNAVQGYMSNDILENYLAQFKPQIGTNTYGGDWNG